MRAAFWGKQKTLSNQNGLIATENTKYYLLLSFSIGVMALSFLFQTPLQLAEGMYTILTSSGILVTDYMEITSISTAFFNGGLLTFLSVLMIRSQKVEFTGPILATVFTIFGFSLFGKNLFNTVPITLGVYLYSKLEKTPFSKYLLVSLFGTALGPVVSTLAFGMGFPLLKGVLIGYGVGLLIGLILPPLSTHYKSYHQGFNLYNVGFTTGIVGMIIMAVISMFGGSVQTVSLISTGNNLLLGSIVFAFCFILFAIGFYYNGMTVQGYRDIFKHSGQTGTDFLQIDGFGKTLINMALQGFIATLYVLFVGGQLNGPVIGGIFTIIGFSAFGKHPHNCLPIFIGVFIASRITAHDTSSTGVLLAALFGTTLAPISKHYGSVYGIIAGFLHLSLVSNVNFLHGGLNLYNNGFSGGFIAAILIPIYDAFLNIIENMNLPYFKKNSKH